MPCSDYASYIAKRLLIIFYPSGKLNLGARGLGIPRASAAQFGQFKLSLLKRKKSYFFLLLWILLPYRGFPHSSLGKEYACNAGDPSLIPGLGRSTGEGIGYPLQYSWASLVAQLVKNLPVMQ